MVNIEGYCIGFGKGLIWVGFNVGWCKGYGEIVNNVYIGWNLVSRIIIEEVEFFVV